MRLDVSDAAAIERSLVEPSYFDIVIERHYLSLYSFLARAVGSVAAADLAQEVFVVAFGNDGASGWKANRPVHGCSASAGTF